jgi:hypothetical protein
LLYPGSKWVGTHTQAKNGTTLDTTHRERRDRRGKLPPKKMKRLYWRFHVLDFVRAELLVDDLPDNYLKQKQKASAELASTKKRSVANSAFS